jgi:hypothetical protein
MVPGDRIPAVPLKRRLARVPAEMIEACALDAVVEMEI